MFILFTLKKWLGEWIFTSQGVSSEFFLGAIKEKDDIIRSKIKEIDRLKEEVSREVERGKTGVACVEEVLRSSISWYDYDKLSHEEQLRYKADVDTALKNEALENEISRYKSQLVEHLALRAQDYTEVLNIRMGINVLETLRDRLRNIPDPREAVGRGEDPYAPI